MRLFGMLGGLDDPEIRATFNGGIGMILVVPVDAVAATLAAADAEGTSAHLIGRVTTAGEAAGLRYVERGDGG
jgi:phosphoribosylaminoimidazole (AIR) synthetase